MGNLLTMKILLLLLFAMVSVVWADITPTPTTAPKPTATAKPTPKK